MITVAIMIMMMTQAHCMPFSLHLSLAYLTRRVIRASGEHFRAESLKSHHKLLSESSSSSFCTCGRKHFLEAATRKLLFIPICSPMASLSKVVSTCQDVPESFRPQRPDWYQEFFAWFLSTGMQSYEAEIAEYQRKLFDNLAGKAEKVLEIGVGTGPNLKYYAGNENVFVFGMDPNQKMESYACESARQAGLKPENFRFMQGIGEAIPLQDDSIDVVIATLVLCSVSDVTQTLNEIKRVLKPGGIFLFIEHIAAKDGSFLRKLQNVLDPLQQVVADGCHLTRKTDLHILAAEFSGGTEINKAMIYSFPWLIRPHVYGIAYKSESIDLDFIYEKLCLSAGWN